MRYLKAAAVFVLCMLLGTTAFAKDFSVPDFGMEGIAIPEGYMVCERDSCDEGFKAILAANSFTFETWKSQVMEPSNYYIYAMDNKNNCIYVVCEKNEIQETVTNKDGSKTHKLMDDYNMLSAADEKSEQLSSIQDALLREGVSSDEISRFMWADLGEDMITPYIEYICSVNGQSLHCYETVYNASKITFQFTSPKKFTDADIKMHSEIVKNTEFTENVDYTEAESIEKENLQKKLEEETHSGENTRVLRYILSASIAFVIIFSLIMAVKTQSKKRKKIVVLREAEAVKDDEEKNEE